MVSGVLKTLNFRQATNLVKMQEPLVLQLVAINYTDCWQLALFIFVLLFSLINYLLKKDEN